MAEDLRARIRRGEWETGTKLPSMPTLGREYQVSNITIRGAISRLAREGLVERRERSGIFVVDFQRPRPRTRTLGCYGFQATFRQLSYYVHLFQGLQGAAESHGYEVLMMDSSPQQISWEKIDGCVFFVPPGDPSLQNAPSELSAVGMLFRYENMPTVLSDDYDGMRQGVQHLWQMGHRRIGYLHQDDAFTPLRLRGYHDALRDLGTQAEPNWLRTLVAQHAEEFRGRGRESMHQWLADTSPHGWSASGCTALICQNDRTAIGVLEALREADVEVPAQVSVVGFDNTDECDLVTPRLTSIEVPLREIGAQAVNLLVAMIEGEKMEKDRRLILPARLVSRDTVQPPG